MINKTKINSGVSTVIVVIVILVLGLIAGSVAYYIGSGKAPSSSTNVKGSSDVAQIEKELEGTQLDSIDADLKAVESDAASY